MFFSSAIPVAVIFFGAVEISSLVPSTPSHWHTRSSLSLLRSTAERTTSGLRKSTEFDLGRIKPKAVQQRSSDSMQWSLQRMGEAPLLTAEQEMALGTRCMRLSLQERAKVDLEKTLGRTPTMLEWAKASNFTQEYTAAAFRPKTKKNSRVATPKNVQVVQAFQSELKANRAAKEQLVNANMRLVVSIARRYQSLGVTLQDLVQEGCLGLIRAAEKFDPDRGFRFSTYASWWVQQSVFRALAFQSRVIRLPMHVHNALNRERAARKQLYLETGMAPSDEDVAERVGVPLPKLKALLKAGQPTHSSSQTTTAQTSRGSGAGGTFETTTSLEAGSSLHNPDNQTPDDFVDDAMFRLEMARILDALDDDERFVVSLRYGFGVPQRLSLVKIAELSGMERVWVRMVEQRALRKLRRPHYLMKLRPFSADKEALDAALEDQDRLLHYRPKWQDGTEMSPEDLPNWEELRREAALQAEPEGAISK